MTLKYEFDNLDLKILQHLQKDARTPFLEMARKLLVSGGTIHQRVEKMREAGVITGSKITVNYKKLGHKVTVLLGIHLKNAKDIQKVIEQLNKFNEVTEAYYTTGNYALIVKVIVRNIDSFHDFLIKKLQAIKEIQSTESFICLKEEIKKDLNLVTEN